ncbi:hypothetical protein KKA03_03825, partial [archaeon]|nr:hypothetical protein [archaeon]
MINEKKRRYDIMKRDLFAAFIGLFILAIIAAPVSAVEYVIGDAKEPIATGDPDATYVGSERCKGCHAEKYND